MSEVKIDKVENYNIKEKWGQLVSMRRRFIILNVNAAGSLQRLYEALDKVEVPLAGSRLEQGPGIQRGENLIVTDREVSFADDPNTAIVDVLYETAHNTRGQLLESSIPGQAPGQTTTNNASGRMSASVTQKETNFYRAEGTGQNETITLEHTYPLDDPDYGGQTIVQTGLINVMIPNRNYRLEGIMEVVQPWIVAENLIGAVNDRTWLGQPEHTWMCTDVTWEFRAFNNFFMSFEFQHEPDTWNPTAVFIDDRTDRPASGLVNGKGVQYIRYHKERNFKQELGFKVVGPSQ